MLLGLEVYLVLAVDVAEEGDERTLAIAEGEYQVLMEGNDLLLVGENADED